MNIRNTLPGLMLAGLLALALGCSDDKVSPKPVVLTQAAYDSVTAVYKLGLTGVQNGQDFPHDGSNNNAKTTIRDIFANKTSLSNAAPGTVIIKHVFARDTVTGQKVGTQPIKIFVMHKRESGYYKEGGDWEYITIANPDVSSQKPNGTLPTGEGEFRGKVFGCASCHTKANGKDFIFVND